MRETDGMRDVIKGRARNGMERVGEGKSEIREDLEKDGWDGKGRVWTRRKKIMSEQNEKR